MRIKTVPTKEPNAKEKIKPGKRPRYLAHSYQYSVAGEDLPKSPTTDKVFSPKFKTTVLTAVPLYLLLQLGLGFLAIFIASLSSSPQQFFQSPGVYANAALRTALNPLNTAWYWHSLAAIFAFLLGWRIAQNVSYKTRTVAYGQLGDSRLLTIDEIQDRYKEIDERDTPFDGYGGVAVSHYKQKFYINDDTNNMMGVGTSRSGKGQASVIEMIDNLSRALKQSSLVLNDPKAELFVASYETLQKRGYDVYALNLDDPAQSMSYNPLNLITRAWQRGDKETATQMINSLDHVLYNGQDAGENRWVYEGAQSAVNGMTMSLLDYNIGRGQPEKTTLYNIADMLNELGQLNYLLDPDNPLSEVNALDRYFQSLPPDNQAKKQYGSTSFSGDKARGSILSTVNQGLQPFVLPKNAKMTSMNSVELKSLGFPKSVDMQLPEELFNERLVLRFTRDQKTIGQGIAKVGTNGFTEHNFDMQLRSGDILTVAMKSDPTKAASYRLNFKELKDKKGKPVKKKLLGHENENELDKRVDCQELNNTLGVQHLKMFYTDKPVAIFMLIPDSDTSNHGLASIFIRQLYTELVKQCAYIPSHKCVRRIHFLLDEFGNMIKIPDMAQILTVTNGRNMLWDLFIQSYQQLYSLYGDADGNTIKENCQVQVYIFSTNDDTIEEISKKVGSYTNLSETTSKNEINTNENVQQNAEADRVLTYERVSSLLEGETIVLDPLHRRDNQGRKVRPYPIFNTKETVMPYAYQYLKDQFDPDGDINDIDISSDHATMALEDNAIDYRDFLVDAAGMEAYDARLASGEVSATQRAVVASTPQLSTGQKELMRYLTQVLNLSTDAVQTLQNAYEGDKAAYQKLLAQLVPDLDQRHKVQDAIELLQKEGEEN